MSNIYLTIAIPAYNRKNFIKRLLDSVVSEVINSKEIEIFVSDNASIDGTQQMMSEDYPNITYYKNSKNLGADGNFLECYRKAKGEYVWLVGSDDIIAEGAIDRILAFIKNNEGKDIPLIFLNHNFFTGKYRGIECCNCNFLAEEKDDRLVYSKKELIGFTGRQLTFMSAFLLKKDKVMQIEKPERFLQTNFIQTYFAFAVSEKAKCFGVIFYPCISQDMTPDNSLFNENYSKMFSVFGSDMYDVLVKYAPTVGFNQKQMKQVFISGMLKKIISWIIKSKVVDDANGVKAFWEYVYPNVKTYLISWVTIIPIAICPSWIAKLVYYIKQRGWCLE